ncbi:hypothetical protein MA16_Dca003560 [Dendrobium catenatum]|uniref:DUF4057 domain-containing protein n=1 Tax=Dendrobium catenatum TaxID=906689 RepID=A0A2I0WFC6_9ASPA|nr:hypothetical protein MA16_Dca003560 [Dendrobium catenatum]
MERSTPVRKPHTSTADLLTWPETPQLVDPPVPDSATRRSHKPSGGISPALFGGPMTEEEVESVNKRKPTSGPKLKEMTGSGIFSTVNENDISESGSFLKNLNDKTSVKIYQVTAHCCVGKSTADFSAQTTPEPFRRQLRRYRRRQKPTFHHFRRMLRRKITGACSGGYGAGVFKINEIKSANAAPVISPADRTPENPPAKALFFETEPLWPVTSFLTFSHLACFARRPPSLAIDRRRRRSPDFADGHWISPRHPSFRGHVFGGFCAGHSPETTIQRIVSIIPASLRTPELPDAFSGVESAGIVRCIFCAVNIPAGYLRRTNGVLFVGKYRRTLTTQITGADVAEIIVSVSMRWNYFSAEKVEIRKSFLIQAQERGGGGSNGKKELSKSLMPANQAISGISQISFSTEEIVSPRKPISLPEVAKQRELSGSLESAAEDKMKKQLSDAKTKELSGHDIFGPPPEVPLRPLAARNLELRGQLDFGEPAPPNICTSVKVSNVGYFLVPLILVLTPNEVVSLTLWFNHNGRM